MNIGIDIDGVLTNIQGFNLKHAPRYFKRMFNREVVDESPYDIRDVFNCTEEEYKAYWKKYLLKYVTLEPARKGARKTVRKLRKDGHQIYIISKRVFTCRDDFLGKIMRFIVHNWLWRNGIRYDEIVFCDNDIPDSKGTACLDKNIDAMVDDEPVNIEAIAPIAKVICFDAPYNSDCSGENISRVHNWDEVYALIEELRLKS
jgi:hypothetical protein